jgi:elongation factor Ts
MSQVITAALVAQLRQKTGAGMMDCKRALTEAAGDMEAAIDWLRVKGLSAVAKKAGRVAAEGLVAAKTDGVRGVVVELNAETDFVARNPLFQQLALAIAGVAYDKKASDVDALLSLPFPTTGRTVQEEIAQHIATIGEHMLLRRFAMLEVSRGLVVSYVHNADVPGAGKIGVLVALESSASEEALRALGKQLAMHVAASKPESLRREEIDPALVARERAIFVEQASASGKPDSIIQKMVEGRIAKFYEEVVLLEQVFILDSKTPIRELIANAEKEAGAPIQVTGFVRFGLGEGVEKEEKDFASEVAAVIQGN